MAGVNENCIDKLCNLVAGIATVGAAVAGAGTVVLTMGAAQAVLSGGGLIGEISASRKANAAKIVDKIKHEIKRDWRNWIAVEFERDPGSAMADLEAAISAFDSVLPQCMPTPQEIVGVKLDGAALAELLLAKAAAINPDFRSDRLNPDAPRLFRTIVTRAWDVLRCNPNYYQTLRPYVDKAMLGEISNIREGQQEIERVLREVRDSKTIEAYRAHDLEALREDSPFRFGVSLNDLFDEERRWPSPILGSNTLIHGPPYIGKTCFAIRRAWRTCHDLGGVFALYFNARDNSDDLILLDRYLPTEQSYIIIVDDLHVAKRNLAIWTDPVKAFIGRRHGRVRIVWVARDESIQEFLGIGSEIAKPESFPIDLVVGLFLDRLTSIPRGHRVVAALEAGLDPALGRKMTLWAWTPDTTYPDVVRRLQEENNRRVEDTLRVMSDRAGAGYEAYKGLIPFGSIAFPIEQKFIHDMTGVDTVGIEKLIADGGCIRSGHDDAKLELTEHPFQLRRTLAYIDNRGAESAAVESFSRDNSGPTAKRLADAVLCRYVQSSSEPADALRKLHEYAEWAGVLDPMASAARHIVEASSDSELREKARTIALKLFRTAYPHRENDFCKQLESDLRWWEAQRAAATNQPNEAWDGRRLDLILYEEAYIHYLLERYENASRLFGESVEAGLRAVDRALDAGTRVWTQLIQKHRAVTRHRAARKF